MSTAGTGITFFCDFPDDAENGGAKVKNLKLGHQSKNSRAALGSITNVACFQPKGLKQQSLKQEQSSGVQSFPTGSKHATRLKSSVSEFECFDENVETTILNDNAAKISPREVQIDAVSTAVQSSLENSLDVNSRITSQNTSVQDVQPACSAPIDPEPIVQKLKSFDDVENGNESSLPNETSLPNDVIQDLESSMDSSTSQHWSEEEHRRIQEERMDRIVSSSEYSKDIYEYLRSAELKRRPRCHYMRKQKDITEHMRTVLVDWMVQVVDESCLGREVLFLAVNYLDLFLSVMGVAKSKLQLLGVTCLLVATKFDDLSHRLTIKDIVYITEEGYNAKQIIRMENLLLTTLNFQMSVPTANCFCEKFLKESNAEPMTYSLAMYLLELTLLDYDPFLRFLPSITACACIFMANLTLGQGTWTKELYEQTGYDYADFEECLCHVNDAFHSAATREHRTIFKKYRQTRFHRVALLDIPTERMFPESEEEAS